MDVIVSKHDVPIRLNEERWEHITRNHDYMAGYYYAILETVAEPEFIVAGDQGEFIAVRKLNDTEKYVAVVYREINKTDGFVITAFLTRKADQIKRRRKKIWPKL